MTRLVQAAHNAPDHDDASLLRIEHCRRVVSRALHRQQRAARADAIVQAVSSPVFRAQRHGRRLLSTLSLSDRLRLTPSAVLAERTVRELRGAGDERALEQLLDDRSLSADRWFTAVIALGRLNDVNRSDDVPAPDAPAPLPVTLLLLLR